MKKKYTIIVYSCLKNYLQDSDKHSTRYAIPTRGLTVVNKNSMMILPKNEKIKELKELYEKELLGYQTKVLWTKDENFQMDLDIHKDLDLIGEIQDIITFEKSKKHEVLISPYSNTHYTQMWTDKLLGIDKILGESPHLAKKYSGKDIFYSSITNPGKSTLETLSPHLNIPKGYVCNNLNELEEARKVLIQDGVNNFLIKPVNGSSGRGIIPIACEENFEVQISEPLILCERILIKHNPLTGSEVNCSVEIKEGKVFGKPTGQIIDGTEWIGGIVPSINTIDFLESSVEQAKKLLSYFKRKGLIGLGSFDFISDDEKKSYVIDNNLNRETGAHFPKYFGDTYALNRPFACVKVKNNTKPLGDIWETLKRKNLAFSIKTGKGIFPIIYLQNISSMFISFADSSIEAYNAIQKLEEFLA